LQFALPADDECARALEIGQQDLAQAASHARPRATSDNGAARIANSATMACTRRMKRETSISGGAGKGLRPDLGGGLLRSLELACVATEWDGVHVVQS
jgi:hypothetical protein